MLKSGCERRKAFRVAFSLVRTKQVVGFSMSAFRLKEVVGASFRALAACFVRGSVDMRRSDVPCANVFDFRFKRVRSEHSGNSCESIFWQRATEVRPWAEP